MKQQSKKNYIVFIILFLGLLILGGALTAFIDPFFHYHKPLKGFSYKLDKERYINTGIVNNYDYDAIITGTSMTECFKTSEFDSLFGVNSVKVPFSGGSHREVNELLESAFNHNDHIRYVIRSVDLFRAFDTKDQLDYSEDSYPKYLNDNNPINDVKYLLNKNVLFEDTIGTIRRTKGHNPSVSFDEYVNWSPYYEYGAKAIQKNYGRNSVIYDGRSDITPEENSIICDNIHANIINLASNHPETTFYCYIAPYSIYFFDYINEMGNLDRYLKAHELIISLLLEQENIKVYSFFTDTDLICDANNYKDVAHHNGDVNSHILVWLKDGHGLITKDNYNEYCDKVWDFYHNYDYDSLYAADGFTLLER